MNQQFPTLNGFAPSWADLKTTVVPHGASLVDTFDYSALNFGSTLEIGEQRGASGGRVMKTTTGSLSHEGSATFYRSGLEKLLDALEAIAPQRGSQRLVGLVQMDILVDYEMPVSAVLRSVKLKGVRLGGLTWSLTEGTDAETVEVPLHITELALIKNGVEIVLL